MVPSSSPSLRLDKDGFLISVEDWSPAVAEQLAKQEHIHLSDAHWAILNLIQQYYQRFDHAPSMRPLIKYLSKHLSKEQATSIYLLKLFPGSPAKLAAKIAGLPKPPNCL